MDIGTAHLLEASIKLECSLKVTSRALLLYHHFMRLAHASEVKYDEDMVAAAALNLSGILYEQRIDMDDLICVFYSIANQTHDVMNSDDVAYQYIKRTLSVLHYIFMRLIEFDLNYRLAHQYLVPFLSMIFERSKNIADFCEELGGTCVRFINDFYTQKICLEYQPELIAIACIDLGLYVHGLINDLAMIPAWYMGFACGITPEKVKAVKKIIMDLYEKPVVITEPQQILLAQEQVSPSRKQMSQTQLRLATPAQRLQALTLHTKESFSSRLQRAIAPRIPRAATSRAEENIDFD